MAKKTTSKTQHIAAVQWDDGEFIATSSRWLTIVDLKTPYIYPRDYRINFKAAEKDGSPNLLVMAYSDPNNSSAGQQATIFLGNSLDLSAFKIEIKLDSIVKGAKGFGSFERVRA